jgi:hypothetical protein
MLAPAVRQNVIDLWDDKRIVPGAAWQDEIRTAIAAARIAVLLVSQHFLASDFIAKYELPPLLDAAGRQGLTIFWIYLSPCLYANTAIASFQAAHDISRPLNQLDAPQRQLVLREICVRLIEIAQVAAE